MASGFARYPKDFTAGDNIGTDYIIFTAVRKNYSENNLSTGVDNPLGDYDNFAEDSKISGDVSNVILYMPQKITENYSQGWTNNVLGPEVGNMLGGIAPLDISGNPPKITGGAGSFTGNIVRRLIEEAVMNVAIEGAGKLGAAGLTANAILSATGGVIYNPMMEVLYDGPDFRRFNYEFTLFAKSEDDAKEIYKIVNFFRYCSVPTAGTDGVNTTNLSNSIALTGSAAGASQAGGALTQALSGNITGALGSATQGLVTGVVAGAGAAATTASQIFNNSTRFIKQPPFIQVQYRRNASNHPYIVNPRPCAINNLNIDFTPTGNYTVLDNFGVEKVATVVATTISFSLTEIRAMYSEDLDFYLTNATANTN